MERSGTVGKHLLIMVGYTALFGVLARVVGKDSAFAMVMAGWFVLGVHILGLLVYGFIRLSSPGTKAYGKQLLLASLVVALIGHGLCFFSGLMNMGNI